MNIPPTPLRILASCLGVVAITTLAFSSGAQARPTKAASPATAVYFSDYQWPTTLNPLQASTAVEQEQMNLTQPMGNLVQVQPNGQLAYPELDGPPTMSTDHKSVTFQLAAGMKWSDGTPITNLDYVFAWHVFMSPYTGPACAGMCDDVSSITLTGQLGITLNLTNAYAAAIPDAIVGLLPHTWTIGGLVTSGQLASCSASVTGCTAVAEAYENPQTTYLDDCPSVTCAPTAGPYQISGHFPNKFITYTLNPNFTATMGATAGAPTTMQFVYYPDLGSMLTAADNKQTDVTEGFTVNQYHDLSADANFATTQGGSDGNDVLLFNAHDKKTNIDPAAANHVTNIAAGGSGSAGEKVRQALYLSASFVGLIADTYGSTLQQAQNMVSYCAPIECSGSYKAPFSDYATEKAGVWDPKKNKYMTPGSLKAVQDARSLFKKALGTKKVTLYLSIPTGNPVRNVEADYLKDNWEAVFSTLHVQVVSVPAAHFFDTVWLHDGTLANGNFEAAILGFTGVTGDPDTWKSNFLTSNCMATNAHHAAANQNYMCLNSSDINTALMKAGQVLTNPSRQGYYNTFQRDVSKHAIYHIIAPSSNVWTTDGKPTVGYAMNSYASSPTWNVASWSRTAPASVRRSTSPPIFGKGTYGPSQR